jgi:predicted ATPase
MVHTCLVVGPAGIGKSVLVRRFAMSLAARGATVLMATCQEVGSGIPFAALADLISDLRRDPALGGTDPHWLAEGSRIVPALKSQFPGIPNPPAAPGEAARLRVAEAFYRMIETVAEGAPVLVVLDDFQHIDPASREVLHILTRRMHRGAGLILAAERTDELEVEAAPPPAKGESSDWEHILRVGPLVPGDSQALIATLTDSQQQGNADDAVTAKIEELAAGNPYFIEMLVADWGAHAAESLAASAAQGDATSAKWQPPVTMRVAFSRHYEGLSQDAREILNLLAAAGRALEIEEVSSLLQTISSHANRALREAVGTGILRLEGSAVAFKNELHRAFVYYAMPDASRKFNHVQLARSLTAVESEVSAKCLLEASHHFDRAGMPKESLEAAMQGARLALAQGAPREAERALLAAVKGANTPPPVDALLLLAQALNEQGNYAEALAWLRGLQDRATTRKQEAYAAGLTAESMVRGRLAHKTEIRKTAESSLKRSRECGDDLLLQIQLTGKRFRRSRTKLGTSRPRQQHMTYKPMVS